MTSGINTREMIMEILLQIDEEGEHSHIAIRNALSKYQFLPKQERAFITRVCEGTLEYRILIDYIIDSFSKITVDKMKPPIREILRSAVYQLKFMDRVPDSAVCNEAVKLAQKKGFYNLKPYACGRPQILQRLYSLVENLAGRCCLIFIAVLAMNRSSYIRSADPGKEPAVNFGMFLYLFRKRHVEQLQ